MANILLLERRSATRKALITQIAAQDGWFVFSARSAEEARSLTQSGPIDLILSDLCSMGDRCAEFLEQTAPLPVIVTSDRDQLDGLIDALEAGAVNYIPGHLREARLIGAIRAALSSALETSKRTRLLGGMEYSHSRFSIPADLSMLAAAADRLQASLEMFGLCDQSQNMHIRIALDEALANAFYHGNLDVSSDLKETGGGDFEQLARIRLQESPYCDRRITIEEHLTREQARFVIRDEGNGFDVNQLPDPTDHSRLTLSSGRGIAMMRHFLDDVVFNETGNQVTLVKRCTTNPAPSRTNADASEIHDPGRVPETSGARV